MTERYEKEKVLVSNNDLLVHPSESRPWFLKSMHSRKEEHKKRIFDGTGEIEDEEHGRKVLSAKRKNANVV